jgi:hypothetical protein
MEARQSRVAIDNPWYDPVVVLAIILLADERAAPLELRGSLVDAFPPQRVHAALAEPHHLPWPTMTDLSRSAIDAS